MNTTTCPKCSGAGSIDAFSRLEDGKCFRCGGSGRVPVAFSSALNSISDRDVIAKVYWMITVGSDVIEALPLEKLDLIQDFASEHDMKFGECDFVFGLWLEKFAPAREAKVKAMYDAMPKPF